MRPPSCMTNEPFPWRFRIDERWAEYINASPNDLVPVVVSPEEVVVLFELSGQIEDVMTVMHVDNREPDGGPGALPDDPARALVSLELAVDAFLEFFQPLLFRTRVRRSGRRRT